MKLSIIIPTIGRESLKSVLEAIFLSNNFDQIKPEIIIVVDGAKIDGVLKPVQDDKRVVFLKTAQKVYAAGARNLGIEKVSGDVVVFIGDDTIPEPDWLQKTYQWHLDHPEPHEALLGRVKWTTELEQDRFHQWLEKKAQFDFGRLDKGVIPSWRHFYTSNVSVKRELVGGERFSNQFTGWGFEDTEFGYRLTKKGLQLHYDKNIVVRHDDPQDLTKLINNTQSARKNAQVFEQLHPELNVLPRGGKRAVLRALCSGFRLLEFIPEVKWWRVWKRHWIG